MDSTSTESTEQQHPLATSDAAAAPTRSGFTLRGRKWLYGATLAAAGVVAGSGVTYAVVSDSPSAAAPALQQGGSSGTRGGPMGGPPGGAAPNGTAPDQGTAPEQGTTS